MTHLLHRAAANAPWPLRVALWLAVAASTVVAYLSARLEAASAMTNAVVVETRETMYVPDIRTTKLAFLGYDQAAADVLWLRAIEYFGRHFTGDRRYPWLIHFVDQIIRLDPRFRRVYHWAGASVLYGQTFTDNNVRLSNRFYEAALKQFPEDSEAALRLGLNYYVEMHGNSPEDRKRFQKIGADYIELAANMPGASLSTRQLLAGVRRNLGEKELAVQSLLQLLETANDDSQREAIKKRLAEFGRTDAGELAQQVEQLETRRKAAFEYLPPAFYLLIDGHAPPGPEDRDWRALISDVSVGEAATAAEEP